MKARFNGNYEIIKSVVLNKNEELVIGYNPNHPITNSRYVCWYYNRQTKDYFWGYYTDTEERALDKLSSRSSSLF